MNRAELLNALQAFVPRFEQQLDLLLQPEGDVPPRLLEAMRYAVFAPGKRLRPYLATRCCQLAGGSEEDAWQVAAALECVHAFSLVHDDLPAMDDDDLRRGQPTTHKQFGEALAILAGDALLTLAFELLVRGVPESAQAGELVGELARAAGWCGMVAGQAADILGEAQPPDLQLTTYIQERKTGCLFEAACRLGACAGRADYGTRDRLGGFGRDLGKAFQIADDILDVLSTSEALGKTVGKDARAGKQTYPACVGIDASRAAAHAAVATAVAQLESFGEGADDLRELAAYVVDRNY